MNPEYSEKLTTGDKLDVGHGPVEGLTRDVLNMPNNEKLIIYGQLRNAPGVDWELVVKGPTGQDVAIAGSKFPNLGTPEHDNKLMNGATLERGEGELSINYKNHDSILLSPLPGGNGMDFKVNRGGKTAEFNVTDTHTNVSDLAVDLRGKQR